MRERLVEVIGEALRRAGATCDGGCALPVKDCLARHLIALSGTSDPGTPDEAVRVEGTTTAIAEIVLDALDAEYERLAEQARQTTDDGLLGPPELPPGEPGGPVPVFAELSAQALLSLQVTSELCHSGTGNMLSNALLAWELLLVHQARGGRIFFQDPGSELRQIVIAAGSFDPLNPPHPGPQDPGKDSATTPFIQPGEG